MDSNQDLWLEARKRAEDNTAFFIHFGIYVAVNTFLILMWYTTNGPGSYPWFWIITAGWGVGVVGHFVAVFAGEGYVDHTARREHERLKSRGP